MEKQYVLKPKFQWIHLVYQEVFKTKYGFKGEVWWYTDRNQKIQRISSIHLDDNGRFKALFKIEKGAN